jgi:hypothetical protein
MKLHTPAVALVAVAALVILGDTGRDADAVVALPVTPLTYMAVARTTLRHTKYASVLLTGGAVVALPSGCVLAAAIFRCGPLRYRAYFDGAIVVYVPI